MKEIDYAAPATLTAAAALLAQNGARALAGGTDVIVQVRENRRDAELLVDLKRIPELNALSFDPAAGLTLGQVTTVNDHTCNNIGTVMSQNPGADSQVVAGTAVNITVGQMPPPPFQCP